MITYETLKEIANKLTALQKTAMGEREWQALEYIQRAMAELEGAIDKTKQGQQDTIDNLFAVK